MSFAAGAAGGDARQQRRRGPQWKDSHHHAGQPLHVLCVEHLHPHVPPHLHRDADLLLPSRRLQRQDHGFPHLLARPRGFVYTGKWNRTLTRSRVYAPFNNEDLRSLFRSVLV